MTRAQLVSTCRNEVTATLEVQYRRLRRAQETLNPPASTRGSQAMKRSARTPIITSSSSSRDKISVTDERRVGESRNAPYAHGKRETAYVDFETTTKQKPDAARKTSLRSRTTSPKGMNVSFSVMRLLVMTRWRQ